VLGLAAPAFFGAEVVEAIELPELEEGAMQVDFLQFDR
jgi:hypothetical protein